MYRYKYDDLDCEVCKQRNQSRCANKMCSHIMENLPDLKKDKAFRKAVKNAESCDTYHKFTLLKLKADGIVKRK